MQWFDDLIGLFIPPPKGEDPKFTNKQRLIFVVVAIAMITAVGLMSSTW